MGLRDMLLCLGFAVRPTNQHGAILKTGVGRGYWANRPRKIQRLLHRPLKQLVAGLALWASMSPVYGQPRPTAFDLEALPQGKSVTIPRPATTWVPLTMRARLTATDMPQSLSLRLIMPGPGKVTENPVKLAIYDPNSERVVYATVRPGVSFVYNFRDLRPIMVVSEDVGGAPKQLKLQVESNKPLEISH